MNIQVKPDVLVVFVVAYWLLNCCCFVQGWECKDGHVIPDNWTCDDMLDCKDGSDESPQNCAERVCSDTQFKCNNTRCIDLSYVCNGEEDCMFGDLSDEENCKQNSADDSCENFKCITSGDCILEVWTCDGERDCFDGSDEWECPCEDDTFGCYVRGVALCLKNSTRCDGVKHCDWGEDENKCDYPDTKKDDGFTCPQSRYKCRTVNECIPWKLVCDGIGDCRDSSDEGGLCHAKDCSSENMVDSNDNLLVHPPSTKKQCHQNCHETPDGAMCSCDQGFRLASDGVSCLDINECQEMLADYIHNAQKLSSLYDYGLKRICSQKCTNSPGSFKCTCIIGYALDDDGFTCRALGSYSLNLYVAVSNEIRVITLRDPEKRSYSYHTVYKSNNTQESIMHMDYYSNSEVLFWTEKYSGKLKTVNKEEAMVEVDIGDLKPRDVAVDWATKNIYVSSWRLDSNTGLIKGAISLVNLANKISESGVIKADYVIHVLKDGIVKPVSIALYPAKGIMVIADESGPNSPTGHQPRILVVNMDGSDVRDLVTLKLLPRDLIIDEIQNAVIWTSSDKEYEHKEARVESISLDGTQRGIIMSRKINRFPLDPVSIAVFEDYLFVSDISAREVRSWRFNEISHYGPQNTIYGSKGVVKFEHWKRIGPVKIAHPVLQRPVKDSVLCKATGCSHVCVLRPLSGKSLKDLVNTVKLKAVCLCPRGFRIGSDSKTCQATKPEIAQITTAIGTPTKTKIHAPGALLEKIKNASNSFTTKKTTAEPTTIKVPTCPNPGPVKNANSIPEDLSRYPVFQVGMLIRFACLKGYTLNGDPNPKQSESKIACLPNGTWNTSPPKCLLMKRPFVAKEKIKITAGKVKTDFSPMPVNDGNAIVMLKLDSCATLKCGNWSRCVKNSKDEYSCECTYGGNGPDSCLPPRQAATSYSTSTYPTQPLPKKMLDTAKHNRLLIPLISVSLILFPILLFLSWKCLHKKRYSVDLRYFRGRSPAKQGMASNNRQNILVKEKPSKKEKATSITNPNYTSPTQRKRLPRPNLNDDDDSGFHRSFGSESLSSDSENSTCEGTSGSRELSTKSPTTASPLLNVENVEEEDELAMGDIVIEGSNLKVGKSGGFGKKLGSLFRMRKTESRECMLPKRKKTSGTRYSST